MTPDQLSLLPAQCAAIGAALNKMRGGKISPPPTFSAFIRLLGNKMIELPSGFVILAAIPNTCATNIVCDEIKGFFDARSSAGVTKCRVGVLQLPHVFGRRFERDMLDVYSEREVSALAQQNAPQRQPETVLLNSASTLQIINGIIGQRELDYYVVQNAQYILAGYGNTTETVNRLRFFIEAARATRKTHVLIANPIVVSDWLEHLEIEHEVAHCWLKPYSRGKDSFLEFQGILGGYDEAIPRADGFKLLDQAENVFKVVCGCPYRLNKWAVETLIGVASSGRDKVGWTDFVNHAPNDRARNNAQVEFTAIKMATDPAKPLLVPPTELGGRLEGEERSKRSTKPGQRALGRDDTSQDTAA